MSSSLPLFSDTESFARTAAPVERLAGARLRQQGNGRRRALMVGSGKDARRLAEYLNQHPLSGVSVHGFLDGHANSGDRVLGTVDDLTRVALAEFVDEVIIAEPCRHEVVQQVMGDAARLRMSVRLIPNLFGMDPKVVALERLGDLPMLKLREQPIPSFGLFLKGLMDLLVSAVLLAVLAPLIAGIALLIAVTSGWPVFYRAQRIGQKGRGFLCHKFRTMVAGADSQKSQLRRRNERRGPIFKIADDPRVTRIGRCLRRYSLDELPQLWNVLCGEMSLVGPRPHPVDDCQRYEYQHLRRLEVKPGITGLWQVTARNDPSFQRNMDLDVEYIERWSLWLDLQILSRTIVAVLRGSGT